MARDGGAFRLAAGLIALAAAAIVTPLPAAAQDGAAAPAGAASGEATGETWRAPFLTLNEERLFSDSLWGKRVERDLAAEAADLAAENRRLEAELAAEEKDLTDKRPKTAPEDFRRLADEFDTKVVGIRAAQDAKGRDLARRREQEARAFFAAAVPYLSVVLRRHGAVAILDARAIFLADKHLDVTDEMLVAVDDGLGEGTPPPMGAPATGAEPDPAAPGGN